VTEQYVVRFDVPDLATERASERASSWFRSRLWTRRSVRSAYTVRAFREARSPRTTINQARASARARERALPNLTAFLRGVSCFLVSNGSYGSIAIRDRVPR